MTALPDLTRATAPRGMVLLNGTWRPRRMGILAGGYDALVCAHGHPIMHDLAAAPSARHAGLFARCMFLDMGDTRSCAALMWLAWIENGDILFAADVCSREMRTIRRKALPLHAVLDLLGASFPA